MMLAYWKRVTSFNAKCLTEMSYNASMSSNREMLSAALVAICVDRIGDGLRSLTIREMSSPMGFDAITVLSVNLCPIGEGCPNVETINFEGYLTLENVHFDSFSHLKTLTISTAHGGLTAKVHLPPNHGFLYT